MWLIDIDDRAYTKDENGRREFHVIRKELQFPFERYNEFRDRWERVPVRQRHKFFVVESWDTPESKGDTCNFEYYEFMTYQEACIFIADLIIKLNSSGQNDLIKAAKGIADEITKCPPKKLTRLASEQEKIEREEAKHGNTCVYVFQLDNDTCKIGISGNPEKRSKAINGEGGVLILKIAYTQQRFTKRKAREIEATCHAHFEDRRKVGEYFYVSFDEAKAYLATYSPVIEPDD